MDNTEMVTKISFVFLLAVNFYLIFKLYRLDTEIRKQKIKNDIISDLLDNTNNDITKLMSHTNDILEHDRKVLEHEDAVLKSCTAILDQGAKINSDAEAILGMYKGLTLKLNEGSNDELL